MTGHCGLPAGPCPGKRVSRCAVIFGPMTSGRPWKNSGGGRSTHCPSAAASGMKQVFLHPLFTLPCSPPRAPCLPSGLASVPCSSSRCPLLPHHLLFMAYPQGYGLRCGRHRDRLFSDFEDDGGHRTIIITTARSEARWTLYDAYRQHLETPRVWTDENGKQITSTVLHVRETKLGDRSGSMARILAARRKTTITPAISRPNRRGLRSWPPMPCTETTWAIRSDPQPVVRADATLRACRPLTAIDAQKACFRLCAALRKPPRPSQASSSHRQRHPAGQQRGE